MNEYLPSKQFIARLAIILAIALVGFSVYKLAIFLKNKAPKKNTTALIIKPDVIQKDSNDNGIPDWEESLWGLDPLKNGASNKEYILAKRATLAKENALNPDSNQPLTENETLAREFFSIIMSLQESGNLDETSINAVSDTIGKKIVPDVMPDIYTKNMLTTIKTNPTNRDAYYIKLAKMMNAYVDKDIGKELTFISVGLSTNDQQALTEAGNVALAYRSFGRELMKMQVPSTESEVHLSLANDYEKVAKSIEQMIQMLADPITGMKGVINYKKYSDALVADVNILSKNSQ